MGVRESRLSTRPPPRSHAAGPCRQHFPFGAPRGEAMSRRAMLSVAGYSRRIVKSRDRARPGPESWLAARFVTLFPGTQIRPRPFGGATFSLINDQLWTCARVRLRDARRVDLVKQGVLPTRVAKTPFLWARQIA